MKKAILILSYCYLIAILISCGARKVDKRSVQEEIKTEQKDVVKTDLSIDSNTKIENRVIKNEATKETIKEKIYTPIDPNRNASFTDSKGNKQELNNASYTERETDRNKDVKESNNTILSNDTKTADKTIKTSENKTEANKSDESFKSDREQYSFLPWWVWIIIASAIFIFILFWYRKAKKAKEVIEVAKDVVDEVI